MRDSASQEFGISPSTDFRFKRGGNHGLGKAFIWVTDMGLEAEDFAYPGFNKFTDEGGKAIDGNLINFIRNDLAKNQFDHFMIQGSEGLSQAGTARLNQSIEAFVYCVLRAQVNVRSSILGFAGSAKEAQREFLILMEDSIRQPDISKSVQRFQLAIDEAKVRLDLAVSPGTWLMPSDLQMNTETTVGYNNNLRKASVDMKLGVNPVNQDTKRVGVGLMDGVCPRSRDRLDIHPAVLKMKPTIVPMRPGRICAIFFPRVFRPSPTPVATDLRPFVRELTITPMIVPTARTTAVTVNPYFLKMFFTLSLSESLSSSSSLSCVMSSRLCVFSLIRSRTLSLNSTLVTFSSLNISSSF